MKWLAVPEGARRHLRGWQAGLALVGAVALGALLVVPRPVEPEGPPLPHIDRREQARTREVERERAARARRGLPVEVRSVGEVLRRLGLVSADADRALPLTQQLRRVLQVALARHGDEHLLELRALQTELFVDGVMRALPGEQPAADLLELGGGLYRRGREQGWFASALLPARRAELETAYRLYWSETLGLAQRAPFAPSLNEWRTYYRYLLERPLAADLEQRRQDAQRSSSYVAALAAHDRDYPAELARGVLLYHMGAYPEAAAALEGHLREAPGGPFALRAQNYLAACGARLIE